MATVLRLPDIGEGLTEAEIVEWLASVGDEVEADHPVVVVETDKTQAELPAPVSGVLLHRGAAEGAILEVGAILAVIGEEGEEWAEGDDSRSPAAEPMATRSPSGSSSEPAPTRNRPQALPLVRRVADEAGIDLTEVQGTGPGGRITRADLDAHIGDQTATRDRPPLVGTLDEVAEDIGDLSESGDETVRLSPTRRAIADRLTAAWREIPHVTTFDSFDATLLLSERRRLADELGHPVALEALVISAIGPILRRRREFNATLSGDQLTLHGHRHVGFAVDGGDGLLVAVVRDADVASVAEVAKEVHELADAAKARRLTREQSTGATFTVSNIGAVGGGYGTPIIPLGTSAILSIGRAADTAVVRGGGIHIAPMAPLSLSYDHRIIDGAQGRAFMADVVSALEGRAAPAGTGG